MKKYFNFIYLSCFTFLSYNQFVYADSGFRHLDQDRGQISCPLYKNRLISSLQRLNEFDYAEKIKKKKFSLKEYKHLLTLFQRHEIPFLENEILYFEANINLTSSQKEVIKNGKKFMANSPFLKFESEQFIFPETALEVLLNDDSDVLKITMPLNYYQACFNKFNLEISILGEHDDYNVILEVDKYEYDKVHLLEL